MAAKTQKVVYSVLLYPPHGSPRVVELPRVPPELVVNYPMQLFETRGEAETALEKFLTDNPEYRQWRDGRIADVGDDPEQFDRLRQPGFGTVPGIYE
jgi:hypothetical protein